MKSMMGKMVPDLIKMLGRKSETVQYPAASATVPDKFRGMLRFDAEKCVGCKLCVRVCPSDAIEIERVESENVGENESGKKRFKAIVHLDKCIFCGQCAESCNKDALENTADFELASADKASLKVEI